MKKNKITISRRLTLATLIAAAIGFTSIYNTTAFAEEHGSSSDHGQQKGAGAKKVKAKVLMVAVALTVFAARFYQPWKMIPMHPPGPKATVN